MVNCKIDSKCLNFDWQYLDCYKPIKLFHEKMSHFYKWGSNNYTSLNLLKLLIDFKRFFFSHTTLINLIFFRFHWICNNLVIPLIKYVYGRSSSQIHLKNSTRIFFGNNYWKKKILVLKYFYILYVFISF